MPATESLNINMKRWTTSKPLLPDVGNINEPLLSTGIFICQPKRRRDDVNNVDDDDDGGG